MPEMATRRGFMKVAKACPPRVRLLVPDQPEAAVPLEATEILWQR
jgi:hypothetical protein